MATHDSATPLNDSPSSTSFLNPEAMLAPGVAGSIVMLLTNTLALNLEFDEHTRKYTGLVLSFSVGLLVLAAARELWKRAIYYVLNSLIIFSVAFGTANLAHSGEKLAWIPVTVSAFAQQPNSTQDSSTCEYLRQSRKDAENRHDSKAVGDLDNIISRNCSQAVPSTSQKRFFGQWK